MRIGIDIDDTMTDTHSGVVKYKNIAYPERNASDILPEDLFIEFMDKYELLIYATVELKAYAKESIQKIHENNEVIIITSRSKKGEEVTKEYLRRNGIPYDQIFFEISNKGILAKELGIDLFIDDHNFICKQMVDAGVNVIKMHRDNENHEYREFKDWQEILDYIINN